jgi:HlyD family secretion protein
MIQDSSTMDRPLDARRDRNRRILLLALLVTVPLALLIAFFPSIRGWMGSERSVALSRLRVAEVVRGDLEREVSVQGRIVAAFHPTTSSPASGIVALKVRAGDVVERGQTLAVVDSPELSSKLEQERSTLSSLESELERQRILARQAILADRQRIDLAEVELEASRRAMRRAKESREQGIINDVDYEKAQDDLRRAEVGLAHARENADLERETLEFEVQSRKMQVARQELLVEEVGRQVERLAVRAPVAGLVSRLDVQDHDPVVPGQPLVAVVDLSAFEVEVLVPENYADEVGPGTPAVVECDGRARDGVVRSISPEVEGSQVRAIVTFRGESPEGLRQNQRVSTRLVMESRPAVLKVARGPFLDGGGGREVYVVEGNVAVLRPVRVGAASLSEVEIVEGLEEGDRIIVSDVTRFRGAERIYLRD